MNPPSTRQVAPVTNDASGLARKRMTDAISVGSPRRRIGLRLTSSATMSGSAAAIPVATSPGATAFTRIS